MIHALGWTWDAAESQLDLHRLQALTTHWRSHPPTHLLVAAYLGYAPPSAAIRVDNATEATGELATTLQALPVVNAPRIDDSAWLAQMTPKETET